MFDKIKRKALIRILLLIIAICTMIGTSVSYLIYELYFFLIKDTKNKEKMLK